MFRVEKLRMREKSRFYFVYFCVRHGFFLHVSRRITHVFLKLNKMKKEIRKRACLGMRIF